MLQYSRKLVCFGLNVDFEMNAIDNRDELVEGLKRNPKYWDIVNKR